MKNRKKQNKIESKKKNRGFSLAELMIAVALIAILTSIIISVANFSDTQRNLMLAKNELQAAVRTAQGYSLSIPVEGVEDICGFGVQVDDNKQYSIFYTFDNNPATCENAPLSAARTVMQAILIKDSKLTVGTVGDAVFFHAPYGNALSGTITLTSGGGSLATITVNSQGQIN